MIVETIIHYSQRDIAKRCWGCIYLEKYNDFDGKCICKENKVKIRDRSITSKACAFKNNEIFNGDSNG